jgi:hypothetical protein
MKNHLPLSEIEPRSPGLELCGQTLYSLSYPKNPKILPCSQEPATGPYSDPADSVHTLTTHLLSFNLNLPSHLWLSLQDTTSFPVFQSKQLYTFLISHSYSIPGLSHLPWIDHPNNYSCRSRWPRGLRRRSAAAWLPGSRVRIPLRSWMFVSCVYMLCCPV